MAFGKGLIGVVDLYARLVTTNPQVNECGVAIACTSGSMKRCVFTARAAEFSRELVSVGIGFGDTVAVLLGNGAEFLIAAFGIWRVGAVLAPLNPRLRTFELRRCLSDIHARVLVAEAGSESIASSATQQCDFLETIWLCSVDKWPWLRSDSSRSNSNLNGERSANPIVLADAPAITQYTTGSSGIPKRITRTHAQLLAEVDSISTVFNVTSSDRILGVAPFYHSYGLMNAALLALLSGATLYWMPHFFPSDAARMIEGESITILPAVPFMLHLLAELRYPFCFKNLRCVVSAGAPLPIETAKAFHQKYGVSIRQLYGTSESGVVCVQAENRRLEFGNVGRPIPGVSVKIVDQSGSCLGSGIEGRIQIQSLFSATQYENSASIGESYFENESFYPGDLGELAVSGELSLRGRDRGFINVAGRKVDPAEVERTLQELPEIDEVAVLGIPDGAAGERIKAVIVTSGSISVSDVRSHCARRLAEFKVPKTIEFRNEIPKNSLGKILRTHLLSEVGLDPLRWPE